MIVPKSITSLLGATLLLATSRDANAVADIRGEVHFPDGNVILPGTVGRLVFTVYNDGPDIALGTGGGSVYFTTPGFRTFELFPLASTAPCEVVYIDFNPPPPQPVSDGVAIQTRRDLGPGESATCEVGISTFPESPTPTVIRFGFGPLSGDPDPSNNQVFPVIYSTQIPATIQRPETIPASSPWTRIALVVGLLGSFAVHRRRERNNSDA